MTATPRIFTTAVKNSASERGLEVISMDDNSIFGNILHEYNFASAIHDKVLTDYRIVVIGVEDTSLAEMIDQRELVKVNDLVTDAKTLASHVGLSKAMTKYKLNGVITFHSRVQSASYFAQNHLLVLNWLKKRNKTKHIFTATISGKDSSDKRKEVLNLLRRVDSKNQGLVTNARCLTEGVDVPTLDGIAFIDPKKSQIDIVQAVGRAIRRGGVEKKFGYIVIPVFLSKKDITSQDLENSDFSIVYAVIDALRSHDYALGEKLESLRFQIGKRKKIGKITEKLIFDLPLSITQNQISMLTTQIIKNTTSSWIEWYSRVESYALKFNKMPTQDFLDHDEMRIGVWVNKQRVKKDNLPNEKKDLLEKLPGWVWEPFDEKWEQGFEELKKFTTTNNHSLVPLRYQAESGFFLGHWVVYQRQKRNRPPGGIMQGNQIRNRLSESQISRLEALPNWAWDSRELIWNDTYQTVLTLSKKFSLQKLPKDFKTKFGIGVDNWITTQISVKSGNKLSPIREKLLEEIPNWKWAGEKREANFEQGYKKLGEYISEKKTSRVPSSYLSSNGFKLGSWVMSQKINYKNNSLTDAQINKLKKLPDWIWYGEKSEIDFNKGLSELKKFLAKNSHILVPRGFKSKSHFRLDTWIQSQKNRKKRGTLSKEQIARLNKIPGWKW